MATGELRLLLGAQQNHRQEFNHPTAPAQPGLDLRLTTASYEARYLLPSYRGYELTVGAGGMSQPNEHLQATDVPLPPYQLHDLGGFAVLKKTLGQLELTGGLRLDTRRVSWDDFYAAPNPATGFDQAAGPGAAGAARQFAAFGHGYQGISASLGGSYALRPHLVLRANLARGYRAPNIPEIGSNGLDPGAHIVYLGNREFGPEFSWQQDVGVLWQSAAWEGSAEVFHNYVSGFIYQARLFDAQGQPVEVVPGNATYQYQQAARLYGGELAHRRSFGNRPQRQPRPARARGRGRPLPAPDARPQARTELRLTAPTRPGRLAGTYLRIALDATAAQTRPYAVDGAETPTAGYTLLGVGAGTTWRTRAGREALQLFVQVDNLLDAAYQSHLNRLKYFEYYQASPTGRLGIYTPGRNVSLKLVAPF